MHAQGRAAVVGWRMYVKETDSYCFYTTHTPLALYPGRPGGAESEWQAPDLWGFSAHSIRNQCAHQEHRINLVPIIPGSNDMWLVKNTFEPPSRSDPLTTFPSLHSIVNCRSSSPSSVAKTCRKLIGTYLVLHWRFTFFLLRELKW